MYKYQIRGVQPANSECICSKLGCTRIINFLFSFDINDNYSTFESFFCQINQHVFREKYAVILLRTKKKKKILHKKIWIICDRERKIRIFQKQQKRHDTNKHIECFFFHCENRKNKKNKIVKFENNKFRTQLYCQQHFGRLFRFEMFRDDFKNSQQNDSSIDYSNCFFLNSRCDTNKQFYCRQRNVYCSKCLQFLNLTLSRWIKVFHFYTNFDSRIRKK